MSCEYVSEFAKDLTYEGVLLQTPQRDILTEQLRRGNRPQGHVDVVVTDAPPAISTLYAHPHEKAEVDELLEGAAALWTWNVLLHRNLEEHYETRGRWQGVDAAKAFHEEIVVPFVPRLPAERLFELHVDDVPSVLVAEVQRHLSLAHAA